MLACLLLCIILRLNKPYFNIRLDGLNLFTSFYLSDIVLFTIDFESKKTQTLYCLLGIALSQVVMALSMRVYIRVIHLPHLFLPELLLILLGSLVINHPMQH